MATHTSPTTANEKTVLVVDDDPTVTNLCQTFLEQAGFSVLTAAGSSEALKICKQHPNPIHLLLTDLVMPPPGFSLASSDNEFPHVHGHELAVRTLRMRKELRVILMSGNLDFDLASYGIRKDALPFLSKPFDRQSLVNMVHRTLQAPPPTPESITKEASSGAKGADEWFD